MLKCPNCDERLEKIEKNYKCSKGHTFDISKYGHTNLLLSNQKNSKIPGDSKEMVLARKKFLEQDNYKGISDRVNQIVIENSNSKDVKILDIGCGEGYYTGRLEKALRESKITPEIYGVDISKEAVIAGAKEYKGITWCVGSATHLPILSDTLDFIICMFAKIDPQEKMRVLKKGGKLIIVSTGENHLEEMKKVVYPVVKKEFYLPSEDESLNIFKHIKSEKLNYKTEIIGMESIQNLFNMTPYRWRSPEEGVKKLFSLEKLETTVEVTIDIFEK